ECLPGLVCLGHLSFVPFYRLCSLDRWFRGQRNSSSVASQIPFIPVVAPSGSRSRFSFGLSGGIGRADPSLYLFHDHSEISLTVLDFHQVDRKISEAFLDLHSSWRSP